ncbi:MAG: metal-dependent transcriptional regulator [Dermatophilaceae bacterium]
MTDMIDTTEMYLRTIFELEEEGTVPMRARIAERLGHSGPTVSQTVARMERDGLLRVSDDRHLVLSDEGRLSATRVMRKHRIAELLLVEVLGLEYEHVHEEACRLEHVISDRVELRVLALLGDRNTSPYGNPIPGLDDLFGTAGMPSAASAPAELSLRDLADGRSSSAGERYVVVRRIGELAQVDDESLAVLIAAGVLPGTRVRMSVDGNDVVVHVPGSDGTAEESVRLAREVAQQVFAAPA